MQIAPDQLAAHLKQAAGLQPVYTVHGDEPLLAQEAGDAIRAAARAAGLHRTHRCTPSAAPTSTGAGLLGAARR
jgi:DNA polymerase-3 subunit delta